MINRSTYIGIFLLSMSVLLFELALIRIYSATLFYHFAFMAISVAMLGLSAAGLTVYFKPKIFRQENTSLWATLGCIGFAVSLVLTLEVVFRIPVNSYLPPDQIAGKLSLIYLLSALPFYFAGLVFSGLFAVFPKKIGKLYAYDLVGAGIGSVAIIPLMNMTGGETIGLLIAASGAFAGLFFVNKRFILAPALVFLILLLMTVSNQHIGWLNIYYSKGHTLENIDARYKKWNSFSKVMVIPYQANPITSIPTWGPSPNYPLPENLQHLSMMTDDGSSTPIVPFDGNNFKPIEYLKYDITSLGHRLHGDGKTLIIGSGGGRDVLTGLMLGAEEIDAVDINPLVFDAMNGKIREFSGNLYNHPKVDWHVAEGRAFARRHEDQYDLVQIAMIDTWAATSSGAYSLAENTLYTVEAFQDYLHCIKDDGMLSLTRFYFNPPRQALRIVSIYLEAAKREGMKNPEDCILVAMHESLATIIVKKQPFTPEQITQFKNDLKKLGFNLSFAPDERPDPHFRNLIEIENKNLFYKHFPFDVTPPTDDKPFFFNMLKMADIMKVFDMKEGNLFNYYATYTLVMLLIISIIATLIVFLLPMMFQTEVSINLSQQWRILLYFLMIGLAYLMIEVILLQRFVLLLEHPAYAASGVVAGMLIASGLGSLYWGSIAPDRRKHVFNISLMIIIFVLLIQILFGSTLIHTIIKYPLIVKILVSMVLLLPPGFFMGIILPAGITHAERKYPHVIPWCWAINGAASVVASVLAVAIAMSSGYNRVLWFGLVAYAIVLIIARRFEFARR